MNIELLQRVLDTEFSRKKISEVVKLALQGKKLCSPVTYVPGFLGDDEQKAQEKIKRASKNRFLICAEGVTSLPLRYKQPTGQ